ncbi:hypothetical protein SLS62_004746 [Diatrype stigma]|uniref:Uncharacterized protein n=1 Tax=Diatrype stigma TaxID=117547 RepID=A0AAN9YSS1_9PEZI
MEKDMDEAAAEVRSLLDADGVGDELFKNLRTKEGEDEGEYRVILLGALMMLTRPKPTRGTSPASALGASVRGIAARSSIRVNILLLCFDTGMLIAPCAQDCQKAHWKLHKPTLRRRTGPTVGASC